MVRNPFGVKREGASESILNLQQMDAATCASLKGHMNEYGECLVKAKQSNEDPDIVVLEVLKYRKPGSTVQRSPVYQE